MRHRRVSLSFGKAIVSTAVIAAALMVVCLLAFHHHTDESEEHQCLLCLVFSMPVLIAAVFLFDPEPERLWFRTGATRPILVSRCVIAFYLLRAPPPSL